MTCHRTFGVFAAARAAGVCAAAALATFLAVPSATAFERQWHVGGGLGVASFDDSGGYAAGLHGAYGLSDMFDARLELAASLFNFDPTGEQLTGLYSAELGLSYKLDVLEWIPYFGLGVGYAHFDGPRPAERAQGEATLSAHGGLDYAFSRSFAVGVQLAYRGFLADVPTSLADTPYFTGLLRAEYRWGW